MSLIVNRVKYFFVDGPGGTSKTFLYRVIMATLRNRGKIVLVMYETRKCTVLSK